jgi:hypothetical protein
MGEGELEERRERTRQEEIKRTEDILSPDTHVTPCLKPGLSLVACPRT